MDAGAVIGHTAWGVGCACFISRSSLLGRRPESRDRLPPIKKPSFPRKERRLLLAICCKPCPNGPSETTRAFQIARTQHHVRPATGRFSDSHLTSRPLPIRVQRTVDNASRTSEETEQTLTAARPSRNFTAFPFEYPGNSETCSRNMHFAKSLYNTTSRPCTCQAAKCLNSSQGVVGIRRRLCLVSLMVSDQPVHVAPRPRGWFLRGPVGVPGQNICRRSGLIVGGSRWRGR
jgi:hypothetical protein